MSNFTITPELRESVKSLLSSIGVQEALQILDKEILSEKEINVVLSVLWKFPDFMVYDTLEKFKTGTNIQNNESGS